MVRVAAANFEGNRSQATYTIALAPNTLSRLNKDPAEGVCHDDIDANRVAQTPAAVPLLRPYAALRKPIRIVCSAAYSLLATSVCSAPVNGIHGEVDVRINHDVSRVHRTPTAAVLPFTTS